MNEFKHPFQCIKVGKTTEEELNSSKEKGRADFIKYAG